MAIADEDFTITRRGPRGYTGTAVSDEDAPTYYWYENGVLVAITTLGTREFDVSIGESMQINVFDDPADGLTAIASEVDGLCG